MSKDERPAGRTLDLSVDLPASPEEVWRMLTDPVELARWFAPYVEGSGKVGEHILLGWGPDVRWKTLLAVSEPGRRVVFRDELDYQGMGPSSGPMVMEWTMGPIEGGTRLRLVHSGFGDGASWDEMYDGTASGWAYFLWHLSETLRRHKGQPRVTLSARRPSTLSKDALGARLFGPEGFALAPPQPTGKATIQLDGPRPFLVEHARLPRNLWGRLPELNDALLMVEMEPGGDSFHTGLWLSTWNLGPAREAELQKALDQLADRVFGPLAKS